MPLVILEKALNPVHEKESDVDFSTLIRDSRDAIGLKQYRAAEFLGMSCGRLKNLETGYFRDMPTSDEITSISRLYDLKPNILETKAREHCEIRSMRKKIRTFGNEE